VLKWENTHIAHLKNISWVRSKIVITILSEPCRRAAYRKKNLNYWLRSKISRKPGHYYWENPV